MQISMKAGLAVVCGGLMLLGVAAMAQDTMQSGASTGSSTDKMSTSQSSKDKMFLKKAAEGGLLEVQLGQLATQKASSADVKSFGQKMVDDHTALNESMKPIAQKMGVTPPMKLNKKDQALYDMMNAKSGDEFDKAYLKDMVMDHSKDLREFTMEAKTAADPDLKAAVEHGRDVIKEHKMMVDKLAKSNGVMASGAHKKMAATSSTPGQ